MRTQVGMQVAIAVLLICAESIASIDNGTAQVVPDRTLPAGERSRVRGNIDRQIDGGAIRGSNLFHSFQQFSIPTGGSVVFNNGSTIDNIINRVTGSDLSNIDGLIRANGNANVFLINPNGIVFGQNASLDIGGSLVASTADGVAFDNGFTFSATAPQAPPLLTVNVPVGLQYGSNRGAIEVRGARLQVPDGQTLTLAGGTVNLDGGQLLAPGGRVELASVGDAGEVGLTQQGQDWRLNVPDGLTRADVAIVNNAIVNVRAGGGGSIAITARNLTVTGAGTRVRAGIEAGFGTVDAQAGDIDINATETININESIVSNIVLGGGTGNAGDIKIATGALSLTNGAQVVASTFGQGDAGNINITASDAVSFDGVGSNGFSSGAFSSVAFGAIGRGGDISINTGFLSVTNGAQVSAGTFGQGDAGNINITASDAVFFDGVGSNGFSSGAFSTVQFGAIGRGGDISINTGSLSLTNGGAVSTSIFGRGDAGNINITAKDTVFFDGVGSNGFGSGAYSSVNPGAIGRGGNISINTASLSITNGGAISASTFGQGDAGNITIVARDSVSFDGLGSNGFASGAGSNVVPGAKGQGGNIRIDTGSLSLTNGGAISTSTFGQGDAGNITIVARDTVFFDGVGSNGAGSGADSGVGFGAIGQGGNITIITNSLSLTNGAQVISGTLGEGDAGNIRIVARDSVFFDGVGSNKLSSGAYSSVNPGAIGQGGDISINTSSLSLTNGGAVSTSTLGEGDAGKITIAARDSVSFDGVGSNELSSGAYSLVNPGAIGQGGDISINTGSLSLTNGAIVIANTFGQGDAAKITIAARDSVSFDGVGSNGFASGAYSSVASEAEGRGGTIEVNTGLFSIANEAQLSTSSQGQGDAGNIEVTANQIRLDNQGSIQAQTASGQGGNIGLNVRDYLLLRRGSFISTTAGTAQSGGDGGNITFNGNFIVAVPEENSDISANAFTGRGGRVEINAQGIFGIESRPELTRFSDITASSEFGISGTVTIDTPDVDPSRGLESLPTGIVDPDALIANTCLVPSNRQGNFTIAGGGGLTAQPDDLANSSFPTYELVPDATQSPTTNTLPVQTESEAIVEPDGIYRLTNGELVLGRSCH